MFFESFLANNVKFGSLNEVMQFIDNVMKEKPNRKFNDRDIIDHDIHLNDVFAQIVLTCGYRWIPTRSELNIIWNTLMNIDQENLNRIYYKNNLYEFFSNRSMKRALSLILHQLNEPYLNPNKPPKEIKAELDTLVDIIREYVYYSYSYIDRIDRMDNMVKSVCVISDTDSAIISLDPWYRFVLNEIVKDDDLTIMHQSVDALKFIEFDEFGDVENLHDIDGLIEYEDDLDYDFWDDLIIAQKKMINPFIEIPQECTRYSIINIMSYMLDKFANDYILNVTKQTNSYMGDDMCKMYIKNEFLFKRALMTSVKKHYATIQEIQEGNYVPREKQLDIKGIDALRKSTTAKATQDQMKIILEQDILLSQDLNQLKIIKQMAILEKRIIDSIKSGSKEYYKPLIVKAASHYADPMRIQGIKASMVWNDLKPSNVGALDLTERNSISVAKINFNEKTINKIREINEEVYHNAMDLLKKQSKNGYAWSPTVEFNCIAIPEDVEVPDWVMPLVDTTTIVNDGVGGFPLESVNIQRMEKSSINFTNIVKL